MHFDGAYKMLVSVPEKFINFGVPVAYVDEFAPRILLQNFIALCMALLQANLGVNVVILAPGSRFGIPAPMINESLWIGARYDNK